MSDSSTSLRTTAIGLVAIAVIMTLILWLMGRVAWCQAGDLSPWSWDVWSTHNSQHLVDPYALSHLEHGLGLFLLLSCLPAKWLTPGRIMLLIATVEAAWEISENTPWMINRYRETTISLDYYGDSILNSISDYCMCLAGLAAARRLPWRATLAILVLLEMISVTWIRDSLMLNILMLLYPIEAVKTWQSAGQPQAALDWFHQLIA